MKLHPAEIAYRKAQEKAEAKRAERNAAIRKALEGKTFRQVAAEFGVSHSLVQLVAKEGDL